MFKAVIQFNSNFILVPVGMCWLVYEHRISGDRFRAPKFDPCLNYLLQELLSPCCKGRSVSWLRCLLLGQENSSPTHQLLGDALHVQAVSGGRTTCGNNTLLYKSPHVGRGLSCRFSRGSWEFMTMSRVWLPRLLNTHTWICSSDSFMSAFIYHFQGLTL